ncbi:hypothetical protein QQP08_019711 [Theobroma cacao]|nr:hypothetical protein QQP08_019711 [Theobroma cacao]
MTFRVYTRIFNDPKRVKSGKCWHIFPHSLCVCETGSFQRNTLKVGCLYGTMQVDSSRLLALAFSSSEQIAACLNLVKVQCNNRGPYELVSDCDWTGFSCQI